MKIFRKGKIYILLLSFIHLVLLVGTSKECEVNPEKVF